MTRARLLGLGVATAVLAAGVLLWQRWGVQVWLDGAIAYCF